MLAVLILIVLIWLGADRIGGGSHPATATVQQDVDQQFRTLHPVKARVDSGTEEPHVAIGSVSIGSRFSAEAFVTTEPGTDGCELVVTVDRRTGGPDGTVGGCGRWPATGAAMLTVGGAAIGWVSDGSVTSVTVSGNGYQESARVVAQHFIVAAPPGAFPGLPLTVTGVAGDGTAVSSWSGTLNEWS